MVSGEGEASRGGNATYGEAGVAALALGARLALRALHTTNRSVAAGHTALDTVPHRATRHRRSPFSTRGDVEEVSVRVFRRRGAIGGGRAGGGGDGTHLHAVESGRALRTHSVSGGGSRPAPGKERGSEQKDGRARHANVYFHQNNSRSTIPRDARYERRLSTLIQKLNP